MWLKLDFCCLDVRQTGCFQVRVIFSEHFESLSHVNPCWIRIRSSAMWHEWGRTDWNPCGVLPLWIFLVMSSSANDNNGGELQLWQHPFIYTSILTIRMSILAIVSQIKSLLLQTTVPRTNVVTCNCCIRTMVIHVIVFNQMLQSQ